MASSALLSHHSSNPLEVPTSDPRNVQLRNQLHHENGDVLAPSSDDPINGFSLKAYQHHTRRVSMSGLTPRPGRASFFDPPPSLAERGVAHDQIQGDESDEELDLVATNQEDMDEIKPVEQAYDWTDDLHDDVDDVPEETQVDEEAEDTEGDETDEGMTLLLKPQEEQEEIKEEMDELEDAVPQLARDYKLLDRLGTGTFSSVYKAIDINHDKWHNATWRDLHPPSFPTHYHSASPPHRSNFFVAIKRIYVTSNPERIRNEIAIMEDCRGCRHVSQLITAFRHRDQVVAIMPYHRNDDFRDFYRTLPMSGIKAYFRCLLRALRDIHARGIIHRDVKPANFLFDSRTYVGTLCDFGLACRVDFDQKHGHCLHTPPSRKHIHGTKKSSRVIDINLVKAAQRDARLKSTLPSERVGYPEVDKRPLSKANRAGTRGFRAPEVLFKCSEQSGAIDIWAAGMILLFFLTQKFPLFQSNDDIEALMEIASIIGRRRMEGAATLHNRTFATNVPSVTRDGMTWREFVEKNNPAILDIPSPPSSPPSAHDDSADPDTYMRDIELAFDLLEKLLIPESIQRITARDALYHPFLSDHDNSSSYSSSSSPATSSGSESTLGDDAFFPNPIGEGCCGRLHFIDEVEEHRVRIPTPYGDIVRVALPGQGIAIGNRPCEFHADLDEFKDQKPAADGGDVDVGNESIRECDEIERVLDADRSSDAK